MNPALRWAVLLLLLAPGVLAAQTPDYLAQLKRKAAEWDKIVGQVQGTVEMKGESISKTSKNKFTLTRTFKQNATSMLMIEHQQRADDLPNSKEALGYNASYGFELHEVNGGWRLAGQNIGLPKQIMVGRVPLQKIVATYLSINYPIRIFDDQATRLEKTEVVRKGKQNLFCIRFSRDILDDKKNVVTTMKGAASFDIDCDLSIVHEESEYVVRERESRKSFGKTTREYEGKLGEFPRPKRSIVELKQEGGEDEEVFTSRGVTTYDLRLDAKTPDREFTLSAFGLPEPAKEKDAKKNVVPAGLVGKWVVVGGLQDGATFDFSPNGAMVGNVNVQGTNATINAAIRVEDKKIYSTTTNPKTNRPEVQVLRILKLAANELHIEDERGQRLVMERVN